MAGGEGLLWWATWETGAGGASSGEAGGIGAGKGGAFLCVAGVKVQLCIR